MATATVGQGLIDLQVPNSAPVLSLTSRKTCALPKHGPAH